MAMRQALQLKTVHAKNHTIQTNKAQLGIQHVVFSGSQHKIAQGVHYLEMIKRKLQRPAFDLHVGQLSSQGLGCATGCHRLPGQSTSRTIIESAVILCDASWSRESILKQISRFVNSIAVFYRELAGALPTASNPLHPRPAPSFHAFVVVRGVLLYTVVSVFGLPWTSLLRFLTKTLLRLIKR